MVALRSSDGEIFEVEDSVAVQSQTIMHMIEDNCADTVIPLPNVTSQILARIIDYCKRHADAEAAEEELQRFDTEFVRVDQGTLYNLIMAADYLDIKSLVGLTCQMVANMIMGMTPDEIQKNLNIKTDIPPEEEEKLRRENAWAYMKRSGI